MSIPDTRKEFGTTPSKITLVQKYLDPFYIPLPLILSLSLYIYIYIYVYMYIHEYVRIDVRECVGRLIMKITSIYITNIYF